MFDPICVSEIEFSIPIYEDFDISDIFQRLILSLFHGFHASCFLTVTEVMILIDKLPRSRSFLLTVHFFKKSLLE